MHAWCLLFHCTCHDQAHRGRENCLSCCIFRLILWYDIHSFRLFLGTNYNNASLLRTTPGYQGSSNLNALLLSLLIHFGVNRYRWSEASLVDKSNSWTFFHGKLLLERDGSGEFWVLDTVFVILVYHGISMPCILQYPRNWIIQLQ